MGDRLPGFREATCAHIKILLEWEQEALTREAPEDLADDSASDTEGKSIKPGVDH